MGLKHKLLYFGTALIATGCSFDRSTLGRFHTDLSTPVGGDELRDAYTFEEDLSSSERDVLEDSVTFDQDAGVPDLADSFDVLEDQLHDSIDSSYDFGSPDSLDTSTDLQTEPEVSADLADLVEPTDIAAFAPGKLADRMRF